MPDMIKHLYLVTESQLGIGRNSLDKQPRPILRQLMRTNWIATVAVTCFIAIALFLSAREADWTVNASEYSHGMMTCRTGGDGAGMRLILRASIRCEGDTSYPYLEVDIRELPISVHKRITIGPENLAFSCPSPKEGCRQAWSGSVVFNHLEKHVSGEEIQTDGDYDLKFSNGPPEIGNFKVDCGGICG